MLKAMKVSLCLKRNSSSLGVKMKAWQIHSYGDLSELQLSEPRVPIIEKPTDVLVQVKAASVNPVDKMIIGGYGRELLGFLRNYELEFPLTLGRDFSGIVIGKGHDVGKDIKIGDEVFGILTPQTQGSHAQAVRVCSSTVCLKPKNVNHIEAASLAYVGVTAWSALFLTGELKFRSPRNTTVLILGASGGVGTVATQILKSQGAIVVGTCSEDAMPLIRSLGADQTFNYRDKNYVTNVAECAKYDIILDCAQIGYRNIPNSWCYKRYITLNSPLLSNTDKYGFIGGMAVNAADVIASNFPKIFEGKTVRWGFVLPSKEGLQFIASLIQQEKLKPIIHKVFKFNEVPEAFEVFNKGKIRGKIIVDFSNV
ncbi:reticulon-4-interacting protein 1, mitochondrial [Onthophagus taurus]|uniref:reticulon-4-interacting protein 1, mitochondrial n=1 Tax=Onthophagus taurus TaxID=166361 RepID=UPI000C205586|nr:reticulon-4-interacting protein 1, mitochondrial [Onthophagus taurus]